MFLRKSREISNVLGRIFQNPISGIVVQKVKPLFGTHMPHLSAWDQVLPPLLIQDSANDMPGRQQMMSQVLGPCHLHGKLGWSSWLLAATGHVRSELAGG